jgi:hypothetical protein
MGSGTARVSVCLGLPPGRQGTAGVQLVIRKCNGSLGQKWIRSGFLDDGSTLTAVLRNAQSGLVIQEEFGNIPSRVLQVKFAGGNNSRRTKITDLKTS